MTTTTLTLAEFILQRITEDEAAARAATAGPWLVDSTAEDFPVLAPDASNYTWDGVFICTTRLDERGEANREDAAHIARHDPARVLAECEAKRRIVEELALPHIAERRRLMNGQPSWGDEHPDLLLLLALPFADHPDYNPDWRP